MAFGSAYFVDRVGRRVLLMLSAAVMSINLAMLGCYVYWIAPCGAGGNWIPLVCLVLVIAGFAIGIGPIPWVAAGELIPPRAKGSSYFEQYHLSLV